MTAVGTPYRQLRFDEYWLPMLVLVAIIFGFMTIAEYLFSRSMESFKVERARREAETESKSLLRTPTNAQFQSVLRYVDVAKALDEEKHKPVDNGALFDHCIHANLSTLLESFFFSNTYGTFTVMGCNLYLVDVLPDAWGWIIVILLCCVTMNWMCGFVSNTIHVMTSHEVHFVYYLFGCYSTLLYNRAPPWYVTMSMIVCFQAAYWHYKNKVWPTYPGPQEIAPLFTRTCNMEIRQFCTPLNHQEKLADKGTLFFLTDLYCVFPVYEVLNIHCAACIYAGGIVGSCLAGRLPFDDPSSIQSILVVLAASLVLAVAYNSLPCQFVKSKWLELGSFYPKFCTCLFCAFGAVSMYVGCGITLQAGIHNSVSRGKITGVIILIGHVFHLGVIMMTGFSCLATINFIKQSSTDAGAKPSAQVMHEAQAAGWAQSPGHPWFSGVLHRATPDLQVVTIQPSSVHDKSTS